MTKRWRRCGTRPLTIRPTHLLAFLLLAVLATGAAPFQDPAGEVENRDEAATAPPDNAVGGIERPFPADRTFSDPALIELHGVIDRRMLRYFQRRLESARYADADLVVVEIDSPGGGLEESLEIAETLRDVDWAVTIAFVPDKALSGGALISLGCDWIAMAPTARMGDAGVIFLDENFMFRYASEKIMSDLVRRARDLAEINGHPPALAEAMIDRNALVYRQRDPDSGRLVFDIRHVRDDPAQLREEDVAIVDAPRIDGDWVLVEESGPTRFLDINGRRAAELGLSSLVVTDRDQLSASVGLDAPFKVYRYGMIDTAVYWLNLPIITGLLFVIGLIALYFELSAPGLSAGGLIAGLCFVLFFWSRFLGGTAVWLEVLLFLAGVIFVLVEIFVIPGFGLAGILGGCLLLVSVVMASQSFVIPRTSSQMISMGTSVLVVIGSLMGFALFLSVFGRYMGSLPVLRRFVLAPPDPAMTGQINQLTGKKVGPASHPVVSVGDWGEAESVLRPSGKAKFGRATIDVVARGNFVDSGAPVKVVEISGNRVVVVPIDET